MDEALAAMRALDTDASWTIRTWTRIVEASSVEGMQANTTKDMVTLFLISAGLLPTDPPQCPTCSAHFVAVPCPSHERYPLGVGLTCQCKRERPLNLLKNTIWEHRQIDRVVPFYFLYAAGVPAQTLVREYNLSEPTKREWLHDLQMLFAEDVLTAGCGAPVLVGSPGERVFVDETLLRRRKPVSAPYRRVAAAAQRRQVWLWGAVAEHGLQDGQVMFMILPDEDGARSASSLVAALHACVAPGSRIVHDDWGGYRKIDWSRLPFEHDVTCVVNHSKEIVNIFGEDTNTIENVWGVLKNWLRARHNGRIPCLSIVEGDLWEFLWRRRTPLDARAAHLRSLLRELAF